MEPELDTYNVDISQNGEDFKGFHHPRWGTLDIVGAKTVLKPNESSKASATIFWDWVKQDVPRFTFSNP